MKKSWKLSFIIAVLAIFLFAGCTADTSAVAEPEEEELTELPEEPDTAEDEPEMPAEDEIEEEAEVGLDIHGLISRVEYGGNAAYIFGSMHMGRATWYPLHDTVEEAMRRADIFAFETELWPEALVRMSMLALEYMFLDPGTTLEELLSEDAFAHLLDVIESFGVSYEEISVASPWMLSNLLSQYVYGEIGVVEQYGIDFYIMDFAAEHDLPMIPLNSLEHEVNLAFNLSGELQEYAALGLLDFETSLEQAEALATAYETQDIAQITYFLREYGADDYETNPLTRYIIDVLIIQRSIEFAQEIIRLLEETEEPTIFFVTMGIGHMVGDDHGNVFRYLEDAGFEIVSLYE